MTPAVAVSTASPRRVRRRRHGGFFLAAVVYAAATYAVVTIVQSAREAGPEAGPAVAADDLSEVWTFRLFPDGAGEGLGPDGALHGRFRSWKEALRDVGDSGDVDGSGV